MPIADKPQSKPNKTKTKTNIADPSTSSNVISVGKTKLNGDPDMRDIRNRIDPTLKANGEKDMRFKTNKK